MLIYYQPTTNSLNTTTPTTTTTPTKAATTTNDSLTGGTSRTPSNTNNVTTLTQGNTSTQQPWYDWNGSTTSTTTKSLFTTTNSNTIPSSSNPTIPGTFKASSPITGSNANNGSIPTKSWTNQNLVSSNASVSQNQQLPYALLVPSQQQNPSGVQSNNQQQFQGSLLSSQKPNQSPFDHTTLKHQNPYQSQAPYQKQQTTANQAPIANAGISHTVIEATTTTLDGRASYSPIIGNGNLAAYQWTQLPIGIPVTLTGANTATPTFTAPLLPNGNPTLLIFSLRVMDNHGTVSTNPAVVYIMIKHNPNNSPITRGNNAGTIINQGQQQRALTPNNIIGAPSQSNSPPSQIVSPNTLNAFPSRVR